MTPRTTQHSEPPSLGTQVPMKRIVISFSLAVIMVVASVLYYTLQRAVITLDLEPANEVVETSLSAGADAAIPATVASLELSGNKTFPASPSGDKEDKASGTVTLINNHTATQTLIATTRLLSPDNILFRLRETVTIPAKGKLENVKVVADQPGEASAIGPTKFTIPGLRANLQTVIYAESSEAMRRAEKAGSKVTALDLDEARKTLTESVIFQALGKLREQLPQAERSRSVVYKSETVKAESNVPANTTKSEFTYTVSIKVTAVFYDPDKLREQALNNSQGNTTSGRKVLTLEEQSLAVSVESADATKNTATLQVKFLAKVAITDAETAFRKSDLLGRTPEEVHNYFSSVAGVRDSEVKLSPFWVKSVPTVENHITLQVKE